MPIPNEFANIVDRIIELSRRRMVKWKEGADEHIFLTSLKDFSVKVEQVEVELDEPMYEFGIVNKEGRDLDAFRLTRYDPHYPKIFELWRMARRQALRLDDALRDVAKALADLSEPKALEDLSEQKAPPQALDDLSEPEAPLEEEEGT